MPTQDKYLDALRQFTEQVQQNTGHDRENAPTLKWSQLAKEIDKAISDRSLFSGAGTIEEQNIRLAELHEATFLKITALEALDRFDQRVADATKAAVQNVTVSEYLQSLESYRWLHPVNLPRRSEGVEMQIAGTPYSGPKILPSNVAMVDIKTGLRPAVATDWVPARDNKSGAVRVPIAFQRSGFQEVGLFTAWIRSSDTLRTCTFTMVSAEWAITAAHCLLRPGNISKTAAWLQKPDVSKGSLSDCLWGQSEAKCPFILGKVRAVYVPPDVDLDTQGDLSPSKDIAVLKLDFSPHRPKAVGALPPRGAFRKPTVTLAGYGVASNDLSAVELNVAWQQARILDTQGALAWIVLPHHPGGGACQGDSGGPVFNGDRFGHPAQEHFIVGVISQRNASRESPKTEELACLEGENLATQIGPYVDWICEVTAEAAAGCSAAKVSDAPRASFALVPY